MANLVSLPLEALLRQCCRPGFAAQLTCGFDHHLLVTNASHSSCEQPIEDCLEYLQNKSKCYSVYVLKHAEG